MGMIVTRPFVRATLRIDSAPVSGEVIGIAETILCQTPGDAAFETVFMIKPETLQSCDTLLLYNSRLKQILTRPIMAEDQSPIMARAARRSPGFNLRNNVRAFLMSRAEPLSAAALRATVVG